MSLISFFERACDPSKPHMKPAVWASRFIGRYCDMDKAARRYKLAFGIGFGIWAVQIALALSGFADAGNDAVSLLKADAQSPESVKAHQSALVIKTALYTAAVMALRIPRFAAFGYGLAGFTHKRLQGSLRNTPNG